MARGVNRVQLLGYLGKDPDVRYTQGGSAICNISVATSESWKDRQSGERKERTEWHRCVIFGASGEAASKVLRKGQQVYLEGRIQTRKWQGQDGQDRYSTEVVVSDWILCGAKEGGGQQRGGGGGGGGWSDQQRQPQQRQAPQQDDFDSDIPF